MNDWNSASVSGCSSKLEAAQTTTVREVSARAVNSLPSRPNHGPEARA